jgi:hypothetical protein
MTTILHIGMAKTGTTQLQNSLMLSRAELLEAGILYPEPFSKNNNHRILLAGHLAFEDLPRHMRRGGVSNDDLIEGKAEFLANLKGRIQEERPNTILLSSESLFSFAQGKVLHGLREDLAGAELHDVRVVVYVRRPSSFYLSFMQQTIKSSHRIRRPRAPRYRDKIEAYINAFGGDRIAVRSFDRSTLIGSDIVTDFSCHFLPGIAPERLMRSDNSNETLSADSLAILRRYRMDFYPDQNDLATPDTTRLNRTLAALDAKLDIGKPELHDSVAEAIDYSSADLLWLREAFQIEFAGIDYKKLEERISGPASVETRRLAKAMGGSDPANLSEVIKLDVRNQTAILEELGRSEWATAEEGRGKWVSSLRGSLVA